MRKKSALLAGGITRKRVMRFSRARLATGVALAVALLCAAPYGTSALAATTQSTSSTCSPIYSIGHRSSTNTETWSYLNLEIGYYYLDFNSSGPRTSLCAVAGYRGIIIEGNGGCLEPHGGIVSIDVCDQSAEQEWYPDQVDIAASPYDIALRNVYYNECLYQDMQPDSIVTGCNAEYTDHFEWFYWTSA